MKPDYESEGRLLLNEHHKADEDRAGRQSFDDGPCKVCGFPTGEWENDYPTHLPIHVTTVRDWIEAQGGPYPAHKF
jgi:hypothetical protein